MARREGGGNSVWIRCPLRVGRTGGSSLEVISFSSYVCFVFFSRVCWGAGRLAILFASCVRHLLRGKEKTATYGRDKEIVILCRGPSISR